MELWIFGIVAKHLSEIDYLLIIITKPMKVGEEVDVSVNEADEPPNNLMIDDSISSL